MSLMEARHSRAWDPTRVGYVNVHSESYERSWQAIRASVSSPLGVRPALGRLSEGRSITLMSQASGAGPAAILALIDDDFPDVDDLLSLELADGRELEDLDLSL